MNNGDTRQHILEFILKRFPLARKRNPDFGYDLLANGVIDSLGVLDLVSMLEKDFGVVVNDDELTPENFQSVADIARFVDSKHAVK